MTDDAEQKTGAPKNQPPSDTHEEVQRGYDVFLLKQNKTVSAPKELARLLALEAQLKDKASEKIASGEESDDECRQLNEKLKKVQSEISELQRKLSNLDDELGKAKHVLIEIDPASQPKAKAMEYKVNKVIRRPTGTDDSVRIKGEERFLLLLFLLVVALLLFAVLVSFLHPR